MKRYALLPLFSLLMGTSLASEPAAPQASIVRDAESPMSLAIARTCFITEHKPNPNAKYYMYLFTASWCSPCRALMPKIVSEYPNMIKDNQMEVILVSFDDTAEAALDHLRKFSAPFSLLLYNTEASSGMPGLPPGVDAIPHIIVVDSSGNFIYRGHGLRYAEWQKRTAPAS